MANGVAMDADNAEQDATAGPTDHLVADAAECLWFFVPLPHHLPVPNGWVIKEPADPESMLEPDVANTGLHSSVCILQSQRSNDPLLRETFDITTAVLNGRMGTDTERPPFPTDAEGERASILSIVEVAFPSPNRSIDELLDLAIERARWVQQGVATLTQGPVRLVGRRTLPPFLPVLEGKVKLDGAKPTYDNMLLVPVARSALPQSYGLPSTDLDDERLKFLASAIQAACDRRGFMDFGDLRREAFVQHEVDGNERLAVATYATAGEVLITGLLLHLLWEEGIDPHDAANAFDVQEKHSTRIDRHCAHRLGGNWSRKGDGQVAKYFHDLVHLRHRVVHAGYVPSSEDVDRAQVALADLEHFIGDRLCDPKNLNRYTRTAMAFVGNRGIEKRSRWTKAVETLTNDPDQPDWAESFLRWRAHFDLALSEPTSITASVDACHLLAELRNGSTHYFLWDPERRAGVEIDPVGMVTDEQLTKVDAALRAAGDTGRLEAIRVRLLEPSGPVPTEGWRPDYELFDDMTVSPGPTRGDDRREM